MKNFKLLATSILLLGSVALVTPGFAVDRGDKCDWKYHGGWGHGKGGEHLERLLDLTDEQKATLKAQRDTNKAALEDLHAMVADARTALDTAIEAGANDVELAALTENLGKLHAQQLLAGAKAHKAFMSVLTDEQKQALADLKAKREARSKVREHRAQQSSSASGT